MERIRGTAGPDELVASMSDTLLGGAGDDTLDATDAVGRNRLLGQAGDDLLKAGSRDILVGGAGDDQMFVGSGGAVLVGGAGADGFWIFNGELPERVNVVRDFRPGEDVLGLQGMTEEEFRSLTVSPSARNETDTLVQLDGVDIAILRGVEAETLTKEDFFIAPPEMAPVIGLSVDPDSIPEGESTTITLTLSEPAPESGLEVSWTEEDSDEALGDIELLLDESTNILDFEGLADGDVPTGAVVTIAPGATEATVVFSANEDEEEEGPETTTYTLQPGDGYIVDPENSSDTLTITDEPIEDDSRLEEILERGFLRVGAIGGVPGLSLQQEDGSFTGMGVDLSRAIAVALFDDPDAIEFVSQEFADSFGNTADGTVDISTVAVQNLTRDGSLEVDYSPIYLYDGVGFLVPADSGVTSVADMEGLTIGILEASTAEQALIDAASDAGVEITIEPFPTLDDVFAAYEEGVVDAVSNVRSVLASRIPTLSNPDNQSILDEVLSKDPIGLLVPENESELADVVRWVTYATFQAEEFGITSENVEDLEDSEDPAIARFLGAEGDLGAALGLEEDFVADVIEEVGNYGEIYARNFDEDIIPRGLNEIWTEGGLIYSHPFSGMAMSDLEFDDNDDRNVLSDVKESGVVRVGINGDLPGFSQLEDGEFVGFDVDYGKAIAAAVFGDPEAVEFEVLERSERFSAVANGIVDVTSHAATHNLVRDAVGGVDFAPVSLFDGQVVSAPIDSDIDSLEDLEGRSLGVFAGTTSEQNIIEVLDALDITVELVPFDNGIELNDAYQNGEVDAVTGDGSVIQGLALTVPPEERIPSRPIAMGLSKEPLAMAVDENQSEWKDVVSWTVYATIQAAEWGITSENIDDFLTSEDTAIRRFLGVEGDLAEGLGLSNDFVVDVISSVGNWQEIYDRNFPFPDAPPIGGGLFTEGGQLYSSPFA